MLGDNERFKHQSLVSTTWCFSNKYKQDYCRDLYKAITNKKMISAVADEEQDFERIRKSKSYRLPSLHKHHSTTFPNNGQLLGYPSAALRIFPIVICGC